MAKYIRTIYPLIFLPFLLFSHEYDPSPGFKQNIKFEHISVEQGLSNNTLQDIIQDDVGFMWFATEDGLNKYDGYEFTVYSNILYDSTSLSNNYCYGLYLDNKGILWIATINGLNKYDRKADRFIRYLDPRPEGEKLNSNPIHTIFNPNTLNNEILWLGTEDGLYKFNRRSELYEPYFTTKKAGLDSGTFTIRNIVKDFYGNFWLGTKSGLFKFNEQRGVITPFPINAENPKSSEVYGLCLDQFGILWCGTLLNEDGLIRIDPRAETYRRYQHDPDNPNSISSNSITELYMDSSGDLWVSTFQGGLNKFNREAEHFFSYQNDKSIPNTLSNNSVWTIYEDRSHVFWIGNYFGGINKFDRKSATFNQLPQSISNSINLFNVSVTGIVETQQEKRKYLWIGTWGDGLLRLNQENGNIVQFRNDPANPNSLSHDIVTRLATYSYKHREELWISTFYGLNKLDLKTGKFTRYYHNPNDSNSPSSDMSKTVFVDKEGLIWLGTYGGMLDKFDSEKNQFKHINIQSDDIYSFCEDHNGNLWIAEDDRLIKLDKNKETFTTFFHNPDDPTSLSNPGIVTIHESKINDKYFLWVGTGNGLNRFDYKTGEFTHFNELKGSPRERIYSILEDKHGNLWLGCIGLYKFNPRKGSFRKYDAQDGLYQNQFNWSSCLKSSDGKLLFGGESGITAFYPDSIKDNPHVPTIVITDFQIFNETVPIGSQDSDQEEDRYHLPQHISTLNEITLSYKESIFSFEFTALDYHSPQKNQYAYMMEGVDPDWVYTDASRRFASYTNLDPGDYTFRVKGSNNDGVWNEEGTSIKIIITPPWWKTNLANTFYVLLIGFIVFTTWRLQLRRIRMKQQLKMEHFEAEKLREVDHLKSSFFANISHEFRTPLTLIEGPVKQMLSGDFKGNLQEQYKMILRYSGRLLNLINQILDLSKLELGRMKLKVSCTEVTQFLKGIVQSFSSLAERTHITLGFKTELESISGYVDKDKLEKIVTNLLSNAFKFTPEGGIVDVNLSLRGDMAVAISTKPACSRQAISEKEIAASRRVGTRNDGNGTGGIQIKIFNSGAGIPPDQLDKIFDRFYQADDSYTKDSEGSGIGLALTKELVEAHHGEIRVESESNKGTTFTLWLPIEKEHFKQEEIIEEHIDVGGEQRSPLPIAHGGEETKVETIEAMPLKQPAVTPKSAPLLLIVEDNPDVTTYISSFLEKDYRIIIAENGQVGLKKALDKFPDLIISDVMMPVMDGFQFCRKLKSDQKTSHIPLILLTARADLESKLEGLEFGADDYVTKPFDAKELSVRSKNLLEQRRRLREHFQMEVEFHPSEITVNSMDEQFMQKAIEVIEQHMDDAGFSAERFSQEMGMSHRHLNRKLCAITNHSARDFLRAIRLKRAAQLLQKRSDGVIQIAYQVGFNNPSYFSESFRQQFGMSPSKYRAHHFK